MSEGPTGARIKTPQGIISRTVGDVIKAVLAHVSNQNGGGGVRIGEALHFLDRYDLAALDSALAYSPDELVSSSWGRYLHLDGALRLAILTQARGELAAIPAESFVAHEYIGVLVTRAA